MLQAAGAIVITILPLCVCFIITSFLCPSWLITVIIIIIIIIIIIN